MPSQYTYHESHERHVADAKNNSLNYPKGLGGGMVTIAATRAGGGLVTHARPVQSTTKGSERSGPVEINGSRMCGSP